MNWTTLVSCEDLAASLQSPELRIVDARFVLAGADPGGGESLWRAGHIPGAGYVHLDRDLSDLGKPPSHGRHPMPEAANFCAVLERLGISPDAQVVVYDAADGAMAAARFWWLLKLLGHRRVAVLDGGFARWTSLGLPVATEAIAQARGQYDASFDTTQFVGTDEVAAALASGSACLIDARAAERFRGEVEPLDRAAGHIPGARNRPFSSNMSEGRFRGAEELKAAFGAIVGDRDASQVMLSCGSGVTACHNLLAMEHAGLHGARIYAGSWSGWVSDPSRPVATGPD
ncbi:MAG: sulfurtransferase [Gammaproteobacteria bacterium RIFCSPHIGHO2_12_FULL_63_22]|nr:MAG: sulfurtransferase [Gammaproteobacteria bacterium RIFCSPHIGHO2_12_FULL_63_22]